MKYKIAFEFVWWVITLVVVSLFMIPIYLNLGDRYTFYFENILLIIIAITFFRYIFFLKHHWITFSNWIKAIFIFVPIPILFYLLGAQYDFQRFADEEGLRSIMDNLHIDQQNSISTFIKTEMVFFWAAAFICNALLPFRMIISIWRKINKGIE